ncbi:division/cell wall cluster transcriptional repressor MraZ [Hyphobacterium marinum]|uniref:Transcriptional regulator MraZ n=1 Tax=Hyphobacterium marinum TaxID=3116574 RepID=A0ABU7LWY8_9PROT|nr:division/cell wall cluster transcriptional repressor MraZ [Hyphobacterium sp. Y6023]MEE2566062.1 division/cell wall cluster transcriptional repressor MraZ [Hyphobacterium sp. Y6023]
MFLSTTTNGIDAKGRLSVPADFRTVVRGEPFDGIYVWPSFDGDYLEGGGQTLMDRYLSLIEGMAPYDDARVAMERSIFGAAKPLGFDSTGRITLPKAFADHAGLDGKATFVGLGARFEIWNPETYAEKAAAARAYARENKRALKLPPVGVRPS